MTHEVERRFPRGVLDRPAQLALRGVHHVQLELARKALVELHVYDVLYSAERRRQHRADDEEAGARSARRPASHARICSGGRRNGLRRTRIHCNADYPILNGNRGSIVMMRRSDMDCCAASSACADTRKLSV